MRFQEFEKQKGLSMASRVIRNYARELGADSMDYGMFMKSADLLDKDMLKSLAQHIEDSDTAPREYVMKKIADHNPEIFKKMYGDQEGYLSVMKPQKDLKDDDNSARGMNKYGLAARHKDGKFHSYRHGKHTGSFDSAKELAKHQQDLIKDESVTEDAGSLTDEQKQGLTLLAKKYSGRKGVNGDPLIRGWIKARSTTGVTSDGWDSEEVEAWEKRTGKELSDWSPEDDKQFINQNEISRDMEDELLKVMGDPGFADKPIADEVYDFLDDSMESVSEDAQSDELKRWFENYSKYSNLNGDKLPFGLYMQLSQSGVPTDGMAANEASKAILDAKLDADTEQDALSGGTVDTGIDFDKVDQPITNAMKQELADIMGVDAIGEEEITKAMKMLKVNTGMESAEEDKDVEKAKQIAKDKAGDMTGASQDIDTVKKGLSRHPEVADALKRANEELNRITKLAGLGEGASMLPYYKDPKDEKQMTWTFPDAWKDDEALDTPYMSNASMRQFLDTLGYNADFEDQSPVPAKEFIARTTQWLQKNINKPSQEIPATVDRSGGGATMIGGGKPEGWDNRQVKHHNELARKILTKYPEVTHFGFN